MGPDIRDRWSRPRSSVTFVGAGRTKQEFKNDCDINRIMAKYVRTGVPPAGVGYGRYGDFSAVPDYMAARNLMIKAEAQFAALPSKIRERFSNRPEDFLKFVADPKNFDEALTLGLLSDEAVAREAAKKVNATKVTEDKK